MGKEDKQNKCILVFPFVYPSLNRLLKMHPMEYHKVRKSYERGFVAAINLAKPPQFKRPVRIRIILYFTKARRRDADNYPPKFLVDCLVKSGVLIDDSSKYIPESPVVVFIDNAHKEQTLVIIEEIEKIKLHKKSGRLDNEFDIEEVDQ